MTAPTLTPEQARDYAARWVAAKDPADVMAFVSTALKAIERGQLFAWVRRDVRGTGSTRVEWPTPAFRREMAVGHLATELGLTVVDAWHLAEAAGWPS